VAIATAIRCSREAPGNLSGELKDSQRQKTNGFVAGGWTDEAASRDPGYWI
jgi:hypothetical protein